MLFIEETSPPPFYQDQITAEKREQLDKWFIGNRSQAYYLKRFAQFDKQGYLSAKWNWAAFFATFGWLLYRKRYLDCIVYTVAGWSFIQLNMAIILVAFEFFFMSFVPDAYQMLTRIVIALIIWVFWSIMVARWADAYYYRMARREIADVLVDYPQQPELQKAHLKKEGGTSLIGLGLAFVLFLFFLFVLQSQFLPLYAQPKENGIIQDTFSETRIATGEIEKQYQVQGECPVEMPLMTQSSNLKFQVLRESPLIGNKHSSCVLIATIKGIPFPNRNLNDQIYVMYRPTDEKQSRWQCITSLNEKQKPSICRTD